MQFPINCLLLSLCASLSYAATTYRIDPDFKPALTGATVEIGGVEDVLIQPDGKLIVGGGFAEANGVSRPGLCRLNPDGTLDEGFYSRGGAQGGRVQALLHTPGGIMVGGDFSSFDYWNQAALVRVNENGTLDTGYPPMLSSVIDSLGVWELHQTSSGDILASGFFTHINGTARVCFAGLSPQGSLTSLNPRLNNGVLAVTEDSSGRILLGGGFVRSGTTTVNRVARLTKDGSLDTTFNVGSGPDDIVYALATSGNQIYIGGSFRTVQGEPRVGVARLNEDGSLDTTFQSYLRGADMFVVTIHPLPNGNVLIGGYWQNIAGVDRTGVAMLRPDGSLDESFDLGAINDGVNYLGFDEQGNLYVGGYFTEVGGAARNGLARFLPLSLLPLQLSLSTSSGAMVLSLPSQSGVRYTLQSRPQLGSGSWIDGETVIGNGATVSFSSTPHTLGQNFFRVIVAN